MGRRSSAGSFSCSSGQCWGGGARTRADKGLRLLPLEQDSGKGAGSTPTRGPTSPDGRMCLKARVKYNLKPHV